MLKYKSTQRKTDLYDIGDGLTLMNIIQKNSDGRAKNVHTYIGPEGNGFVCVSHADGVDKPGVLFNYADYVRMLKMNLPMLISFYYENIGGKP